MIITGRIYADERASLLRLVGRAGTAGPTVEQLQQAQDRIDFRAMADKLNEGDIPPEAVLRPLPSWLMRCAVGVRTPEDELRRFLKGTSCEGKV